MPQRTKIEWCDYTTNTLKFQLPGQKHPVNLCVPKSPGCANCYASAITKRFKGVEYKAGVMRDAKPVLVEKELQAMLRFKPKPPFKNGRDRAAVFPMDMTDLFGPWVPFELIDRVFAVFALRPDADWLVLTKHPERMAEYLISTGVGPADTRRDKVGRRVAYLNGAVIPAQLSADAYGLEWPLPNCWLGTSVEDQQRADERIPHLLQCPAAVRFLSVEPLLDGVDLQLCPHPGDDVAMDRDPSEDSPVAGIRCPSGRHWVNFALPERNCGIGWAIVGCESNGSRAGRLPDGTEDGYWKAACSLRDQCREAGVPYFHKQGPVNGRVSHEPSEWPEEMPREMPGREAVVTHE